MFGYSLKNVYFIFRQLMTRPDVALSLLVLPAAGYVVNATVVLLVRTGPAGCWVFAEYAAASLPHCPPM